jgi:hypothetical protein
VLNVLRLPLVPVSDATAKKLQEFLVAADCRAV